MPKRFASREQAGEELAAYLLEHRIVADLVLGLPRGGVVVAAPVARALRVPLDVFLVRKIGHPRHREFAIGALAEPDVVLLNSAAIEKSAVSQAELDAIIADEQECLRRYRQSFQCEQPLELAGKAVMLVDDGLATGSTMEAAVKGAHQRAASRVMVVVPVSSESARASLARSSDEIHVLETDPGFEAVGQYYTDFAQTTDEEVIALLRRQSASQS
jgi:predicted phosphoribosyltransferase